MLGWICCHWGWGLKMNPAFCTLFAHEHGFYCPLNTGHISSGTVPEYMSINRQALHVLTCVLTSVRCLCSDRKMVSTHLPLAWTHSSPLEEQELMSLIEDLAKTFQPHWDRRTRDTSTQPVLTASVNRGPGRAPQWICCPRSMWSDWISFGHWLIAGQMETCRTKLTCNWGISKIRNAA